MEKRKHQRIDVEDLSVDIADGKGFYGGQVADVSQTGICIADLSKDLSCDTDKMTLIVSGKNIDFRMNVRPRWYTMGGVRTTVGVEMTTRPLGWSEFVLALKPASGEALSE